MSVPEAHITPKLESLPKGLRDKAEAIIKKKFGLNSDPVEGVQGFVNELQNRMMDNMVMGIDPAFVQRSDERSLVRFTNVSECDVDFYPNHCTIEIKCRGCGMGLDYLSFSRDMMSARFRQQERRDCPRCRTRNVVEITIEHLDILFRRQGMSRDPRRNPMYDLQPGIHFPDGSNGF